MPILLLLLAAMSMFGQRRTGEVRLQVVDASRLPLTADIELLSQSSQQRRTLRTEPDGKAVVKDLPLGVYRLNVSRPQFATASRVIQIQSELPIVIEQKLDVAAATTTLVIADSDTLLDPNQTGVAYHIGRNFIETRRTAIPSRSVLELVESQPGWLLEANGVLHPRGAEYNTQYVLDGIPVLDNRSPGIGPALEAEDMQSLRVMTANYPAEFGRKLGGVVEATTARVDDPGFHARAAYQAGSFLTQNGYLSLQQLKGRTAAIFSAHAGSSDRFLDPPTQESFTNRGHLGGVSARVDHDLTEADRLRFFVHRQQSGFMVPNEPSQQLAGQRQDRSAGETMGQTVYQRVLTPRALLHVRGMVRDLDVRLWSNELSTPIAAFQDRGFREVYTSASVAYSRGNHEIKWGGEWIGANIREQFRFRITDGDDFDRDIPVHFSFAGRERSREGALYAQDTMRLGNWTLSAGLRWDRYSLLVKQQAWSPRLGIARHLPELGLVLRASYDRAFEVPAIENLLLASSVEASRLTDETVELPVEPSRGNFWQAGFGKTLGKMRLDANVYRRGIRNYGDDDVLLNTGISFPIAFSKAEIQGVEAKLELPRWGAFSGFLSWSNLSGRAHFPVTGGLFLDDDALEGRGNFPITQDQRNTVQGRMRWQPVRRFWLGAGLRYGSGLPVELEDEIDESDYDPRILRRVDLERGRVRSSMSIDLAGAIDFVRRERRVVSLQADFTNITNRLNVINFAGVFSGNALGAPRAVMMRLNTEF